MRPKKRKHSNKTFNKFCKSNIDLLYTDRLERIQHEERLMHILNIH